MHFVGDLVRWDKVGNKTIDYKISPSH